MHLSQTSGSRRLKLDYLTRVEGEASLSLSIDRGVVASMELRIFEPPRFFEALLRGRSALEAPDITARICGICPVAYQLTAAIALERALGIEVNPQLGNLRRVLYAGEWIQSHALHIVMLHAPDFLGFDDVASMALVHGQQVKAGIELRRIGNEIVKLLGGREIHPINVRIGGFYKLPSRLELEQLATKIGAAIEVASDCARWVAGFDFPAVKRDYAYLAVAQEGKYPLLGDQLAIGPALQFSVDDFEVRIKEAQATYSNALQSTISLDGKKIHYLTGPIARFNLFRNRLHPVAKQLAEALVVGTLEKNPFASIVIRAVEIVHALEDAKIHLDNLGRPEVASEDVHLKSGDGCAATEAPRGVLYHRYRLNRSGDIMAATIVPPTSQNQLSIEDDLRELVSANLSLSDEALSSLCERAIRNYDPCISCAAHFLRIERKNEQRSEV